MLQDDTTTRRERSRKVWAKRQKLVSGAECGPVLPQTQAVCATFLRLEKAATARQPQGGEAAPFVGVKLVAAAPAVSLAGDSRVEIRLQFDHRQQHHNRNSGIHAEGGAPSVVRRSGVSTFSNAVNGLVVGTDGSIVSFGNN
jgi:hypothetical protein